MILATPFFIREMGPEQYGLWMLINVVVQLMNALNFGVGESTIKEVSKYHSIHLSIKVQEAFNRNVTLSLLLMGLSLGFGFALSFAIPFWHLFQIPEADMQNAMLVLVLFSGSAGLKFIEQVFLSVFKGLQRFDISSRLSMVSRLSNLLAAIMVVYLGYGLLVIVQVTLLINCLNLLLQAITILKVAKIQFVIPKINNLNGKEILKSNGWFWLQGVIALVGFLSDRLLIGYFTDMKTVGYYSIAVLIGSQIHNVLLTFGSFVFPKVSHLIALNKDLSNMYYVSRFFIAGLAWFGISFLLICSDFIFKIWLGAETFQFSIEYINIYLSFIAIMVLIIIPYHFINGSEKLKLNSLFEVVLRSSLIISMLIGFYVYGVIGMLWGTVVAAIINMPFQYYLLHKMVIGIKPIQLSVFPLIPAIFIVFMSQMNETGFKLLFFGLFSLSFWLIYVKMGNIHFATLLRRGPDFENK
jgi:O-antigen/teichoic acid export membrane protein